MQLMTDPVTCAIVAVGEFNRILDSQKPPGLREMADAWNSGTWRDDIRPTAYIDAIESLYKTSAMP